MYAYIYFTSILPAGKDWMGRGERMIWVTELETEKFLFPCPGLREEKNVPRLITPRSLARERER